METEDGAKLLNWYTTRWVSAESADDAERLALDMLRSDPKLTQDQDSKARIFFDEIEEVEESEVPAVKRGFAFFENEL